MLLQADHHIVAFHAQRENLDTLLRRKLRFTCPGVKCPGMPRTDDAIPLDPTLPQRTPPVRAPVVESGKLPFYISDADRNTLYLGLPNTPRRWSLSEAAQSYPPCQTVSSTLSMLAGSECDVRC